MAIIEKANPALLATEGLGPDTAAALLVAAGDNPERMKSERSFAALCGVSPVQASSGRTVRHRLNRGGNRQANNALWRIATTRMRTDAATKDYVTRRRAEGKKRKEAIRCLKRHIAREIYRLLTNPELRHPAQPAPTRRHHDHPGRPSSPNPPYPHLRNRTRPKPQPPPRHQIPELAPNPPGSPTRPVIDLTTIGASTQPSSASPAAAATSSWPCSKPKRLTNLANPRNYPTRLDNKTGTHPGGVW